jgi:hypothetical protein
MKTPYKAIGHPHNNVMKGPKAAIKIPKSLRSATGAKPYR